MIFGIKTKKDKKIAELQEEINRLTNKPDICIGKNTKNIIQLGSKFSCSIEEVDSIPIGYIRRQLVESLIKNLKENISILTETDYVRGRVTYSTTLEVVDK